MTPRWHDSDSVSQYVAGTMPPDAVDAFEEHLLGCAECRREVRDGAAIRSVLAAAPASGVPVRTPRMARTHWIAAAVATAATITIAVTARREPATHPLGAVTPPAFVAGALRAPADPVTALVDSGMEAYAAADFRTAASRLARAAIGDSSAGVAFFLGVARLVEGDNQAALAALLRARYPLDNPYADDATLFAAKALLRLRQPDSAVALLESRTVGGAPGAALRALADSIRRR